MFIASLCRSLGTQRNASLKVAGFDRPLTHFPKKRENFRCFWASVKNTYLTGKASTPFFINVYRGFVFLKKMSPGRVHFFRLWYKCGVIDSLVMELNLVRGGSQPPTFHLACAAPASPADPMTSQHATPMKNNTHKLPFILIAALSAAGLGGAVFGTSANLAGLGVSVNVAQKGMAAGLSLQGGTNVLNVGASYSQGTNAYSVQTTVPTGN